MAVYIREPTAETESLDAYVLSKGFEPNAVVLDEARWAALIVDIEKLNLWDSRQPLDPRSAVLLATPWGFRWIDSHTNVDTALASHCYRSPWVHDRHRLEHRQPYQHQFARLGIWADTRRSSRRSPDSRPSPADLSAPRASRIQILFQPVHLKHSSPGLLTVAPETAATAKSDTTARERLNPPRSMAAKHNPQPRFRTQCNMDRKHDNPFTRRSTHRRCESMQTVDVKGSAYRKEVMARVGLKKTAIYELRKRNQFPMRTQLTHKVVGWYADEIEAWLQHRSDTSKPLHVRPTDF
jgi:predicted DNA-binding transcriptional regulator AlpA